MLPPDPTSTFLLRAVQRPPGHGVEGESIFRRPSSLSNVALTLNLLHIFLSLSLSLSFSLSLCLFSLVTSFKVICNSNSNNATNYRNITFSNIYQWAWQRSMTLNQGLTSKECCQFFICNINMREKNRQFLPVALQLRTKKCIHYLLLMSSFSPDTISRVHIRAEEETAWP